MELTASMINQYVDLECDTGTHSDFIENYDCALDFYLSNAERESYIDYLKEAEGCTTEEAEKLQAAVIAEIKSRL